MAVQKTNAEKIKDYLDSYDLQTGDRITMLKVGMHKTIDDIEKQKEIATKVFMVMCSSDILGIGKGLDFDFEVNVIRSNRSEALCEQ